MKEGFDSETVYYEKYLKFKIKYDDKIQIFMSGFCKERSHYVCLSEILIDVDFKISKNQYPQVFIEECKYVIKENKMSEFINDKFEISSDKEVSDEELIKTQDKDSVFLVDCC